MDFVVGLDNQATFLTCSLGHCLTLVIARKQVQKGLSIT